MARITAVPGPAVAPVALDGRRRPGRARIRRGSARIPKSRDRDSGLFQRAGPGSGHIFVTDAPAGRRVSGRVQFPLDPEPPGGGPWRGIPPAKSAWASDGPLPGREAATTPLPGKRREAGPSSAAAPLQVGSQSPQAVPPRGPIRSLAVRCVCSSLCAQLVRPQLRVVIKI